MMVEAGGTEKSWSYYEDGAPKVTEEVLASGLEASKQWIRESINLQRQLVEAYTAARGPIETIPYQTFSDYEDDVWARVETVGTDPIAQGQPGDVESRAQRRPRRRRASRSAPPWATSSPTGPVRSRRPSAR